MSQNTELNDGEVQKLTQNLKEFKEQTSFDIADSWLKVLYSSYTNRFLSDNNRIWVTASIFTPLSLTPFAALVALDKPEPYQILVLAFSSIFFLLFWNFTADQQRCFQDKSLAKIKAIEMLIGIRGDSFHSPKIQRDCNSKFSIQKARWSFFGIVVLVWILIICFFTFGCSQG